MSENRNSLDAAAFCALPIVRRAYMALVAGLAVFIVTLVALREPFRGYLAEVRISGPAILGLDLEEAAKWLKDADSRVVIIAAPAGERSPRSQIRMTYLAPLPTPATSRLDELAARWLYQYLPQSLQAFRHAELAELRTAVAESRAREDAAEGEVEALRQEQLALVMRSAALEQPAASEPVSMHPAPVVAATTATERDSWCQQLEAMRLVLARLLGRLTEEHPEVISLRSQIDRLEQQVQARDGRGSQPAEETFGPRRWHGRETVPQHGETVPQQAPADDRHATPGRSIRPAVANRFLATRAEDLAGAGPRTSSEVGTAVTAALARLAHASRTRQAAEQRLSDRMQEISSQPAAAEWSAEAAHVVTRLGGTPRCSTLALGGVLSAIGAALMFRVSAVVVKPTKIESASELASALEIPVIGNIAALRKTAARLQRRVFTGGRVRVLVRGAEIVVGVAILACLLAILIEPSLARQVAADPFGTLSEVIGRIGI